MAAPINLNKLQNFHVDTKGIITGEDAILNNKKRIDSVSYVVNRLEKVAVINEKIAIDEQNAKDKNKPKAILGSVSIEQDGEPITELSIEEGDKTEITVVIDKPEAIEDLIVYPNNINVVTVTHISGLTYEVEGIAAGEAAITAKSMTKPGVVTTTVATTVTEPLIMSSNIENDQQDVPLDSTIILTFSKEIAEAPAPNFVLLVSLEPVECSVDVDEDRKIFTITPNTTLIPSASYDVQVNVTDVDERTLETSFTFHTAESLTMTSNIENNEQNVPLDTDIVLTFSEAIAETPEPSFILSVSEQPQACTIVADSTRKIFTITPDVNLMDSASYTIAVNVTDIQERTLETSFTFHTVRS